jgi:hypothetical protein
MKFLSGDFYEIWKSYLNWKIIPDVSNDLFHKCAKYQFHTQILSIVSFTKNDKRVNLSMYISKSPNFYQIIFYFLAHNIKNFILKICMLVGYIIDHVKICFKFFETYKHEFRFFSDREITRAREEKTLSGSF